MTTLTRIPTDRRKVLMALFGVEVLPKFRAVYVRNFQNGCDQWVLYNEDGVWLVCSDTLAELLSVPYGKFEMGIT